MAEKIQIAGLLANSRHEEGKEEVEPEVAAGSSAGGKGKLRMPNVSATSRSATEPRKNGSTLCAADQPTISEQNTAPTPQKKFSRLTALALEPAPALALDPEPISAISKLSDGTSSPSPSP